MTTVTNLCPDPQGVQTTGLFWPTSIFDVMDYGAHADPTNYDIWEAAHTQNEAGNPYDDQPHIQAAIDACSAAGGGFVYLPTNTYRLSYGTHVYDINGGQLILKQGVTLIGDGPELTILTNGHHSHYSIVTCCPYTDLTYPGINIGVRNLSTTYIGAWTLSQELGDGLKLFMGRGILIDNCEFYGQYSGINLNDCQNVLVTNSISHDQQTFGFSSGGIMGPEAGTGADNVIFRDCETYACPAGFRTAGLPPASGYDERVGPCTFDTCYGHDNVTYNFYASYADDFAMTDCIAENAPYNVLLKGVHTATIDHTTYGGSGGSTAHISYNADYGTNTGIVIDGVVMD